MAGNDNDGLIGDRIVDSLVFLKVEESLANCIAVSLADGGNNHRSGVSSIQDIFGVDIELALRWIGIKIRMVINTVLGSAGIAMFAFEILMSSTTKSVYIKLVVVLKGTIMSSMMPVNKMLSVCHAKINSARHGALT